MNVSMPIAAVLLDLGFAASASRRSRCSRAPPACSRTWPRSSSTPIGFLMAGAAEEAIAYEPPPGRVMLDPEVETRPWAEQLALDDAAYREQLAYLFERSAFYREKLAAAGVALGRGRRWPGRTSRALPLSDKRELRETTTPENPIGTHLCATREEIVRIYSTSGTTGTPSYIPLTAGDLDNWITGSARSYGASGVGAGQRIVSTYNAGPFVAGAALAAFDRIGLCHIPVGTGNSERLMLAIERLGAEAAVLTPSYARVPRSSGRPSAASTWRRSTRRARAGRGRAGRRRAGVPREARGGLGREGHRGAWASATSASRCGASASSRTACTSGRAGSSTPS